MFVYNIIIYEQTFRTYVRGDCVKKRYRIVKKRKFISLLVLVLTIITMFITSFFIRNNTVYSSTYQEDYANVRIIKGDTLWNIAINHMPEGYDVRKMVFEIIELNKIEDASIYPGDSIKVPIKHNSK